MNPRWKLWGDFGGRGVLNTGRWSLIDSVYPSNRLEPKSVSE